MARVNNLSNFLTDVASAIKTKKGSQTAIPAANFDTEILSIETGGNYQSKTLNVTQNGNYNLLPDQEFDALSNVNISVSVSPILQNKTIRENGSYSADSGYDGLGTVIVNVPTGGSGDVKLFETEQAMQNDPSPSEGDLAVVYREELTGVTEESEFDSCTFPNTVVLDEAFTGRAFATFRSTGSSSFDGNINMSSSGFSFIGRGDSGRIYVEYISQNGITYTRIGGGEELQEFGTTIKWASTGGSFNNVIGNFMKIGGNVFEGLYEYKSNEYVMTKNQLNATPDYVYEKTFYGKNGVEVGTLQNKENLTKDEVKRRVNIWSNYNSGIICPSDISSMFNDCTSLTTIPLLDTSNATNMSSMFYNCTSLTTIPLLDTSNVTNMYCMFDSCKNLTTIPQLDTSNATSMYGMFNDCTSLTTIPLLDTSNVTDMSSMFSSCKNLTTIPQLDTSNATSMYGMFNDCTSLTTIPLLDTSSATDTSYMFSRCTSLTTIPLLDTSNVTNMSSMFYNCKSLTTIPLLDTKKVTNMGGMFYNCTSLSDESLNNILVMCKNAVKITLNKTLKYIGLTSEQANKCKTLSNYSAFTSAGWTTGY